MRDVVKQPFFILSASDSSLETEVNQDRTTLLRKYLKERNVPFKELLGSYKGTQEHSFLVVDTIENVLQYAKRFAQESILAVDSDRQAELVFVPYFHVPYTSEVKLGTFQQVTREEARAQDAWTYDPTENKYWIAK